jgi:hypothetical protein
VNEVIVGTTSSTHSESDLSWRVTTLLCRLECVAFRPSSPHRVFAKLECVTSGIFPATGVVLRGTHRICWIRDIRGRHEDYLGSSSVLVAKNIAASTHRNPDPGPSARVLSESNASRCNMAKTRRVISWPHGIASLGLGFQISNSYA